MIDQTHLLLRLDGDKIYYTLEKYILIKDSSLAKQFSLSVQWVDQYVYARIEDYQQEQGLLSCRIVSDQVLNKEYFSTPERTAFQSGFYLRYISFGVIPNSMRLKAHYQMATDPLPIEIEAGAVGAVKEESGQNPPKLQVMQLALPLKEKRTFAPLTRTLDVRIERLRFAKGWIRYDTYLSEVGGYVQINIKNHYSIEELNDVKPLIIEWLCGSMVQIELKNGRLHEYKGAYNVYGRCVELEKMNSQLLRRVALGYALNAYKERKLQSFKASDLMLTAREMLSKMPGGESMDLTAEEEKAFLSCLYQNELHAEHLLYLSALHQSSLMVVRLMQNEKKEMSFLYLLKGDLGYFFALETANTSHATYLWMVSGSCGMEPKQAKPLIKVRYLDVENALALMGHENRESYVSLNPENFYRISHDYQSENGFILWREKLHQTLHGIS